MRNATRPADAAGGLPILSVRPATIALFAILVLALSWLRLLPALLEQAAGVTVPDLVVGALMPLLATFAPLWAALVCTSRSLGGPGVRSLLSQILRWRVRVRWYAVALLGPPALVLGALTAAILAGGDPSPLGIESLLGVAGIFLVGLVFVAGEEFGWRGFLQPALQARWSALAAAIAVGALWAAWHLPLFLDPEAVQADVPPLAFLALGVGLSVVMAWLYNATRGGLLTVVLGHAALNAWLGGVALALPDQFSVALFVTACAAAVWVVALAVILKFGPRTLAGRLRGQ